MIQTAWLCWLSPLSAACYSGFSPEDILYTICYIMSQRRRGNKQDNEMPPAHKAQKGKQLFVALPDSHTCFKCKVQFTRDDDKLIQCERCEKWQCAGCCGYSDTEYRLLTNRPQLHWFCEVCQPQAMHAVQADKDIEERCNLYLSRMTIRVTAIELNMESKADRTTVDAVKSRVQQLEETIQKMQERTGTGNRNEMGENEQNVQTKTSVQDLDAKVRQHVVDLEKDQAEKDRRKANVIMYDVPKSNEDEGIRRKQKDTEAVAEILRSIGHDIQTRTVNRIGKREEGKTRPLRVVFQGEAEKADALRKVRELRLSEDRENKQLGDCVHMAPDRTIKERATWRRLKTELDMRTKNGETDLIIRNDRVIKGSHRAKPKASSTA